MKTNLASLLSEIQKYLDARGLVVFRGLSRGVGPQNIILWDSAEFPDYRQFLAAAEAVGTRLITLHAEDFRAGVVEEALASLADAALEPGEKRTIEKQLRQLIAFDGYTCRIELSFSHDQREYVFDVRTEWFDLLSELLDRIDDFSEEEDEEESPFGGGYYSNN